MAKDLNKVMIIGNLTKDPELRSTQTGQQVATLAVATNRSWKNATGETQEQAEFHDVVVWGKLAEICAQYLAKGRKAYFEGRLQTRQWEAQDGTKRYRTEIVADDMILLDSKGAGGGSGAAAGAGASAAPEEASQDPADAPAQPDQKKPTETSLDDIPF